MKKIQQTTDISSNLLVHGTFSFNTVQSGGVDLGAITRQFCDALKLNLPKGLEEHVLLDFEVRVRTASIPGSKASTLEMKKLYLALNRDHIYMDLDGTLFDFEKCEYLWKGKDIYLTPGEALFLLKRLVLKEPKEAKDRSVPSKLREKFGKDFLEGLL